MPQCPNCGAEYQAGVSRCPRCGFLVPTVPIEAPERDAPARSELWIPPTAPTTPGDSGSAASGDGQTESEPAHGTQPGGIVPSIAPVPSVGAAASETVAGASLPPGNTRHQVVTTVLPSVLPARPVRRMQPLLFLLPLLLLVPLLVALALRVPRGTQTASRVAPTGASTARPAVSTGTSIPVAPVVAVANDAVPTRADATVLAPGSGVASPATVTPDSTGVVTPAPGRATALAVVAVPSASSPVAADTAVPVAPTVAPTPVSTIAPTAVPPVAPTTLPTLAPTVVPTVAPPVAPTAVPPAPTAAAAGGPGALAAGAVFTSQGLSVLEGTRVFDQGGTASVLGWFRNDTDAPITSTVSVLFVDDSGKIIGTATGSVPDLQPNQPRLVRIPSQVPMQGVPRFGFHLDSIQPGTNAPTYIKLSNPTRGNGTGQTVTVNLLNTDTRAHSGEVSVLLVGGNNALVGYASGTFTKIGPGQSTTVSCAVLTGPVPANVRALPQVERVE